MSDEDRELLIKIQDNISTERDMSKVADLQEQYREISSRTKQLNECTLDECVELKAHIYEKFKQVNGAGKYSIASQFKEMIRQIDIRMSIIYTEMAKKQEESLVEKLEGKETDGEQGKSHIRKSKNKTSWSVSFDDLDF